MLNPAVDFALQDLRLRFGEHTKLVAELSSILPKVIAKGTPEWRRIESGYHKFQRLLAGSTESQVRAELSVWAAMWKDKKADDIPTTAIAALNACSKAVFPNIHSLLQVLAVLPVSAAEAERVFSTVNRTLVALRSTMKEERLEALILSQAFRDKLPSTDIIMDRFAQSAPRRLNFVRE